MLSRHDHLIVNLAMRSVVGVSVTFDGRGRNVGRSGRGIDVIRRGVGRIDRIRNTQERIELSFAPAGSRISRLDGVDDDHHHQDGDEEVRKDITPNTAFSVIVFVHAEPPRVRRINL
jgi:hypothetical protein